MTQTAEKIDKRPRPAPGGAKETIESILIAFVLAFVFRAFVVEAFVIPTGSMATTLFGAHVRFHCPDCGQDFTVAYNSNKSNGGDDDGSVPPNVGPIVNPIYCPNCGYHVDGGTKQNSGPDGPPIAYGDRILVLKYLYEIDPPKRWDVVVFKPPEKLDQNYIKRLVATPGESVMVLDGQLYIRPAGEKDPAAFVVQTKPPHVQEAMWRLVYDNDHRPVAGLRRESVPWKMPWTVTTGNGWEMNDKPTAGRDLLFDNASAASTIEFDPAANVTAQTFTDYIVHDQAMIPPPYQPLDLRDPGIPFPYAFQGRVGKWFLDTPVSDLDLRLTYRRRSGDGPFEIALTKRNHVFRAVITPTQISLVHDFAGKRTTVGQPYPVRSDKPLRVELYNADYRAVLMVDGTTVAATTPTEYAPDIPQLIQEYGKQPPVGRAQVTATGQACTVSHLGLYRDQYYYNSDREPVLHIERAKPANPVTLGPDEYFVMGDNSLVSYDARCWTKPLSLPADGLDDVPAGRVPGRLLLGRAFYVYWPAGYPIYKDSIPLIPNFGEMRFIH